VKRDPALVSLSRDHHQALVVAQKLSRASAETAAEALAALAAYWEEHGRAHFRLEEEVLFPAYAGHGDAYNSLLARALCDHVAIRQRIDVFGRDSITPIAELRGLGNLISDHVRLEERELFPMIEKALPTAELAAVAVALENAQGER
jgi:hemerythrin-like domain-containing protein